MFCALIINLVLFSKTNTSIKFLSFYQYYHNVVFNQQIRFVWKKRVCACVCFSITNKIIYTVDWKRFRSLRAAVAPVVYVNNKNYPPHTGCQPPPFHHRITITIIVSTPSPHPRGPFPTWPFVIFNGVLLLIPLRRVPAQNIIIRVCTIYSRLLLFSFFFLSRSLPRSRRSVVQFIGYYILYRNPIRPAEGSRSSQLISDYTHERVVCAAFRTSVSITMPRHVHHTRVQTQTPHAPPLGYSTMSANDDACSGSINVPKK